jgi:hypothetical protein
MSPAPSSAGRLELELPAQPRSVASARRAVEDFCAGEALDHQAVAIAVSEAVTNAVIHAYPAGVDGRVRLVATLQPGSLVITIADRGREMTARALRRGLMLSLRCSRTCRAAASLTISRAAARRVGLGRGARQRVTIARLRALSRTALSRPGCGSRGGLACGSDASSASLRD